jgi:hypothetical protein
MAVSPLLCIPVYRAARFRISLSGVVFLAPTCFHHVQYTTPRKDLQTVFRFFVRFCEGRTPFRHPPNPVRGGTRGKSSLLTFRSNIVNANMV